MRQHEDGNFYSLLNRVRYGVITQSDEQLFKTRLLQCNQKDVLHIFPTRKKVDEHNTKRLSELSETVVQINAFHYYSQDDQSPLAGLVNGAIGTIVDIGPISPELSNPSFIFVKFDDPKVGKVLANKQFEQSSVALNPVEHQFFLSWQTYKKKAISSGSCLGINYSHSAGYFY